LFIQDGAMAELGSSRSMLHIWGEANVFHKLLERSAYG